MQRRILNIEKTQQNSSLIEDCLTHDFCQEIGPGTPPNYETSSPQPNPTEVRTFNFQPQDQRILDQGTKVVVSDIALDDWLVQQYGFTLETLPRNAPPNMARELHQELRRKYLRFKEQKNISPRSQYLLYPGQKIKVKPKEDKQVIDSAYKRTKKIDTTPHSIVPLVCLKEKNVIPFFESQQEQIKAKEQNYGDFQKGQQQIEEYNSLAPQTKKLITRITYGIPSLSREEVFKAAKQAPKFFEQNPIIKKEVSLFQSVPIRKENLTMMQKIKSNRAAIGNIAKSHNYATVNAKDLLLNQVISQQDLANTRVQSALFSKRADNYHLLTAVRTQSGILNKTATQDHMKIFEGSLKRQMTAKTNSSLTESANVELAKMLKRAPSQSTQTQTALRNSVSRQIIQNIHLLENQMTQSSYTNQIQSVLTKNGTLQSRKTRYRQKNQQIQDLNIEEELPKVKCFLNMQELQKQEEQDFFVEKCNELAGFKVKFLMTSDIHFFTSEMNTKVSNDRMLNEEERAKRLETIKVANFWFDKGALSQERLKFMAAIDCYKQAVTFNEQHYPALFNLGICFQQLMKFGTAITWFNLASKVKPEHFDSYVGCCLVKARIGEYESALVEIDNAINQISQQIANQKIPQRIKVDQRLKSNSLQTRLVDLQYIRALVFKLMGRFDLAQETYLNYTFMHFKFSQNWDLLHTIMGILYIQLNEDRRLVRGHLENLLMLLKYHQVRNVPIKKPMYEVFFKDQNWTDYMVDVAVEFLQERSLFKRFSHSQIKKFLPKMKIKQFQKNDIIFPERDKIYILICGAVEIRKHTNGSRLAEVLGKYNQGDVIGVKNLDFGRSSFLETWCMCMCNLETVVMNPNDFLELWHLHEFDSKIIEYNMFKVQPLFKVISEQALKLMIFEYAERKSYRPGDLIRKQSKRSILNQDFQNQIIVDQLILQRKSVWIRSQAEKLGIDKNLSNFVVELKPIAMEKNKMKIKFQHKGEKNSKGIVLQKLINTVDSLNENHLDSKQYYEQKDLCGFSRFFVVLHGKCQVINKKQTCLEEVAVVGRGTFFGESNFMKVPGLEHFGDILAIGEDNEEQQSRTEVISFSEECMDRLSVCDLKAMIEVQKNIIEPQIYITNRKLQSQKVTFDY